MQTPTRTQLAEEIKRLAGELRIALVVALPMGEERRSLCEKVSNLRDAALASAEVEHVSALAALNACLSAPAEAVAEPLASDDDVIALSMAMGALENAYIDAYELDDGEHAPHAPTEFESLLIADAIAGLLADEAWADAYHAWDVARRPRLAALNATPASPAVAEMVGREPMKWLFVANGECDDPAQLMWCRDDAAVTDAVGASMFIMGDWREHHSAEVTGTAEELIENGFVRFEGDPGLTLIRVSHCPTPPAQPVAPVVRAQAGGEALTALLRDALASVEDYRSGLGFGQHDRKLIGRLKAALRTEGSQQ